jgi:DNA-binding response OmpR family regulator
MFVITNSEKNLTSHTVWFFSCLVKIMRKIFLVEDDQAIREILEIFLTSENYLVQTFATVREFETRDSNVNPDLYLFDVMLPDGSGVDLCDKIKNYHRNDAIPVMIMSAHTQLSDISIHCTPDEFISKPFDIENLLLKIKNLLGEDKQY